MRPIFPVEFQLYRGPDNPDDSEGRLFGVGGSALTGGAPSMAKVSPVGGRPDKPGDPGYAEEKCVGAGGRFSRSVSEPHFPTQEKGRDVQTHTESKEAESLCEIRTFQNGGSAHALSLTQEGGLDGQVRPEGCILLRSHSERTQAPPEVSVARKHLPVQGTAFWVGFSPPDLHKVAKTSFGVVEETRAPFDNVPGRPVSLSQFSTGTGEGPTVGLVALPVFRVPDKLGKVSPSTHKEARVFGACGELRGDEVDSPGEEGDRDQGRVFPTVQDRESYRTNPSNDHREVNAGSKGCNTGPPVLQAASDGEDTSLADQRSELWELSGVDPGVQRGVTLVEHQPGGHQWKGVDHSGPGSGHYDRRVEDRMGCSEREINHSGSVESGRSAPPHKCVGVDSCSVCSESLCKSQEGHTYTCQGRQQDGRFGLV